MGKQGGMGAAFYVGGNDLSGDTNSLNKISGSQAQLDVTGVDKSAHERLFGLKDGALDWVSYFNPTGAHPVLSALPTADVIVSFVVPALAVGTPAACMVAKQVNYNPTRGQDGMLTFAVSAVANAFGLEWGVALTPGMRTDSAAANGAGYDTGGPLAFGGQAYLHVAAFTGTDATVTIQDSADNLTFANVTGLSFTQVTGGAPLAQRIAVSNTSTIRRYVRAVTTTTGGFSSLKFAVVLNKNPVAGVTF